MNPKKLMVLAVAVCAAIAFVVLDLGQYLSLAYLKLSQQAFQQLFAERPLLVVACYFAIYVLATTLALPGGAILTLAGGALFGLGWGLLIVSFASSIGATCAFLMARFVFRDAVEARFGQRLADSVARVGGSWPFVAGAGVVIAVWMTINGLLSKEAFDPYPYILLNLVLSCLAALQAPIIMMSQNRASLRDRHAADLDFQVNLKAELEIEALHAKLDHLMQVRWEALLEMQDLQLQLLRTLENRVARDEAQAVQGPA